ncbi:MAG: trypsin-like peptidase domain-containing protein, partial [Saprospiraceae bacterium]|nr:trypsin-like peptidase domain-containing protein [Saprospiraceae bacterium]
MIKTGIHGAFLILILSVLQIHGAQGQSIRYPYAPEIAKRTTELVFPVQPNERLLAKERANRQENRAPQFAVPLPVQLSIHETGSWTYTQDKKAIWRHRFVSLGAYSLNIGFSQFQLPEGALLFIYSADGSHRLGPLTRADNDVHGTYWSPIIPTDDLYVEIQIPLEKVNETFITIANVNHDFTGFGKVISGSCNLDVVCSAQDGYELVDRYRDVIESVGLLTVDGTFYCSGFLINNAKRDCRPFFMTAEHCGINANNAGTVVIYWNHENSICRAPEGDASGLPGNGSFRRSNSGTIWRSEFIPSDMTLLELDDPVHPEVDAFLVGWSANEDAILDTVFTVHHPSNEEKRISFDFDRPYRGEWQQNTKRIPEGNHLVVANWEIGSTEDGSSGAPLFNTQKQVIGQLHGGRAACGNSEYDAFGWFGSSWEGDNHPTNSLKFWLDSGRTGIRSLSGQWLVRCQKSVVLDSPSQTLCPGDTLATTIRLNEAFEGPVRINIQAQSAGINILTSLDNQLFQAGSQIPLNITQRAGAPTEQGSIVLEVMDDRDTLSIVTDFFIGRPPSNFTMITIIPEVLPFPTDSIPISWTESENAFYYTFKLSDTQTPANTLFSTSLSERKFTLSDQLLEPDRNYSWRIEAVSGCGVNTFQEGQFSTGPDASISLIKAPDKICSGSTASFSMKLGLGYDTLVSVSYTLSPEGVGDIMLLQNENTSLSGGGLFEINLSLNPNFNTDKIILEIRATDGELTGIQSFQIPIITVPEPPTQAPRHDGLPIFRGCVIRWPRAPLADRYQVQVSSENSYSDIVLQQTTEDT